MTKWVKRADWRGKKKNKVTINNDNNDDNQQLLLLLAGEITFISSESANHSVTNALPRSLICIPSESLSLRVSSLTGRQDQNSWVIDRRFNTDDGGAGAAGFCWFARRWCSRE